MFHSDLMEILSCFAFSWSFIQIKFHVLSRAHLMLAVKQDDEMIEGKRDRETEKKEKDTWKKEERERGKGEKEGGREKETDFSCYFAIFTFFLVGNH